MATASSISALLFCAGCAGGAKHYQTPGREASGYVVILPGIEGRSIFNTNIAKGLVDGGVPASIEIYDWTAGGALTWAYNLRAESRNREEAHKIACKIIDYQDAHPGRPVHLIGHSGGGGMAIYVLEALPATRHVNSTILLAGALSPEYNLTEALQRSPKGIYNFYSKLDIGFLRAGTTVFGTVDGKHVPSSGAVGFEVPDELTEEGRRLYRQRLFQTRYSHEMARSGHIGGHFGWADRHFVADWLAPLILKNSDLPAESDSSQGEPMLDRALLDEGHSDEAGSDFPPPEAESMP